MNISKFTQKSLQAVQDLEKTAYDFGNQEIEQEHLLYNLLHQDDSLILKMIEKMEINKDYFINTVKKALDAKVKVNGNDVTLTVGKYNMKLPASKAKAVIDGGYDGKTVVMGIRPENVHDSQMFIETSKDSVVECKINVYELLGAEVYLYFDCEGFPMTARVDPRTTARSGDTVKFALDMEKVHLFDKETEITITN